MPAGVTGMEEAIGLFNAGDREGLERLAHPDFELISPLSDIRGRPYAGLDGLREWFQDVDANFESVESRLETIEEVRPGRVLGVGRARIKGRTSGLDYELPLGVIVDWEGDRLRRMSLVFDTAAARRQAEQGA